MGIFDNIKDALTTDDAERAEKAAKEVAKEAAEAREKADKAARDAGQATEDQIEQLRRERARYDERMSGRAPSVRWLPPRSPMRCSPGTRSVGSPSSSG